MKISKRCKINSINKKEEINKINIHTTNDNIIQDKHNSRPVIINDVKKETLKKDINKINNNLCNIVDSDRLIKNKKNKDIDKDNPYLNIPLQKKIITDKDKTTDISNSNKYKKNSKYTKKNVKKPYKDKCKTLGCYKCDDSIILYPNYGVKLGYENKYIYLKKTA